ncbi:MAG: hypothetical protein LBE86_08880 [Gemmobacter sp.]|jgi:anti-sigma factor RsiW|nr:hypothetical protein [Gemmobacter sp.]
MRKDDQQLEQDIASFVNDQLDAAQRFSVAEYLATHPDRAAEVMSELRLTEGLRLAFSQSATPSGPQLSAAADQLTKALSRRHLSRRIFPFAASVAIFTAGWAAQDLTTALFRQTAMPSPLLDAALDAEAALRLRLAMASQPESQLLDHQEISANLGILIPQLPDDWKVKDVQVMASPERPGLAVLIDAPSIGEMMLFSVTRSADGPDEPPQGTTYGSKTLAYFEKGQTAYVIVDNAGPENELLRRAAELRNRLN